MGKRKFNKKQSVRFTLIPGVDEKGNPTVLYKPIQTKSSLPEKQRQKIVNQIADMDIQINGKPVKESQIPLFILEQIKGRSDLIFNQNHPQLQQQYDDEGDLYEQEMIDGDEEEWELDEDQFERIQELDDMQDGEIIVEQQKREYEIDGEKVLLTAKQAQLLNVVIPQNYDTYKIQGVQFSKYDEDGNPLSQKQMYEKYLADPNEKRAIIDSFDYVPEKMKDVFDSDLKPEELQGDMKDLDDALNYQGPQQDYQALQDDFFASLLQNNSTKTKQNKKEIAIKDTVSFTKKKSPEVIIPIQTKPQKPEKTQVKQQNIKSKYDDIDEDDNSQDYEDMDEDDFNEQMVGEQITDEMLEKAIEHFDKKYNEKTEGMKLNSKLLKQCEQEDQGTIFTKPEGISLIQFLESKEELRGRDGELDWRILTKEQKKQFMKTNKIRDFFQEVRERQIAEKMKNKKNISPEELHLKSYVQKIAFQDDHVFQEALVRDAQEVVNLEQSDEDYETESSEDDIISYRAKTSIISSNLATVQQPHKKKKKKQEQPQQNEKFPEKIKVVPEKRTKNETKQQRKARKDKLKQMKKSKKEQKKQFSQLFEKQKRKFMKNQNQHQHNVLHKVSHIKIA